MYVDAVFVIYRSLDKLGACAKELKDAYPTIEVKVEKRRLFNDRTSHSVTFKNMHFDHSVLMSPNSCV